jgi:cyclic pyranopterin phosphate synthase
MGRRVAGPYDAGMKDGLSHVGSGGEARMVDVGSKPESARRAVASARVHMAPGTLALALAGGGPKGAVLETARLAGIQGAKRTSELIPLCHPLPLDLVDVTIEADGEHALCITATAAATWRTGVEMEALTAAAVAALTVIDMLKAVERTLVVSELRLESKSGGKHGDWRRPA